MYLLRDEHIEAIIASLRKQGITDELLQADLLDHACCYIEEKLKREEDFEDCLQEAINILAPQGLKEIEEEKFLLFHLNKQISMKKAIFFTGFSATFFISTGITFKMLHWPGANMFLMTGFICLILSAGIIFINARKYAKQHSKAYRARIIVGVVAALMIALGGAFKIAHLPSANILSVLGFALLNFVFLPMFFLQLYKKAVASPQ